MPSNRAMFGDNVSVSSGRSLFGHGVALTRTGITAPVNVTAATPAPAKRARAPRAKKGGAIAPGLYVSDSIDYATEPLTRPADPFESTRPNPLTSAPSAGLDIGKLGALVNSVMYLELNLNGSNGNGLAPINRQVVRTSPILDNADDYCVAVARLVLPQLRTPLWIPDLNSNSLSNPPVAAPVRGGLNYSLTLSWFPAVAPPVSTTQQLIFPDLPGIDINVTANWNFIYSPRVIIQILNQALAACFTSLSAAAALAGTPLPPSSVTPYISFTPSTGLMTMNMYPFENWQNQTPAALFNLLQLHFSANMLPYLAGWPIIVKNSDPAQSATFSYEDILFYARNDGNDWQQFDVATNAWSSPPGVPTNATPPGSGLPVPPAPGHALLEISQECSGWQGFTGLSSVQLRSTLPVENPQMTDQPQINGLPAGVGNTTQVVLTDFNPDYAKLGDTQQPLVYEPQGLVPGARFIPLTGGALSQFNLTVHWIDSQGNEHPMYTLGSGQTASVLLMFVKKRFLAGF